MDIHFWYRKQKVVLIGLVIVAIVAIPSYFLARPNKTTSLPSTESSLETSAESDILQTVCQEAVSDYSEWTENQSDLIIWETPSKKFNYRQSPESSSVGIDSPVTSSRELMDLDFIGLNEICYVDTEDNSWEIGLYKLNGMDKPDNSIVYEESGNYSFIDISPINKGEYIVFLVGGEGGALKYLDAVGKSEFTLATFGSVNTDGLKLATSPKGTSVYLLHNKTLSIFDIDLRKQVGEIGAVNSVVWLGNAYLLYSNNQGTFVYEVETKEKQELDGLGPVTNLSFNPKDGGVIAYNTGGNTTVLNCLTGQTVNSKQNTELRALASERTAIVENPELYGFWRFKDGDWTVTFIDKSSKIATVWKRY